MTFSESDTYASVHKATAFDREPLSTETKSRNRGDSVVQTPKTPVSHRQQSDYDLNDPLPWESETKSNKQATVAARTTYETKRDSPPPPSTHTDSTFNDDYASLPTIKPKPRLSLQTKTEEPPTTATIQEPKQDLFDINWMNDEQKSPMPEVNPPEDNNSYASNEFEENADDSDH